MFSEELGWDTRSPYAKKGVKMGQKYIVDEEDIHLKPYYRLSDLTQSSNKENRFFTNLQRKSYDNDEFGQ